MEASLLDTGMTEVGLAPYRVLARKYRPTRLSELIGQEGLVRTLANALRSGRIAHAFLLSGIRGVGKTTTARIIARALNCTGPDGQGGPTPEPCGLCPSCRAIAEERALDVIEMDAATRTGIDDIREIVDSVRYAPTASRYKVYIIDEVHMLSEKAFNGLLKTLEEPPPHAKFVFATTEIRKVPVTVLSRCQRFDLRRVEAAVLEGHLARVCDQETVAAEPAALALIAGAAEGSVRDGLSLLDQAVALAIDGRITATTVEAMLGLGDRRHVLELLEAALAGDAAATLERFGELYVLGAEPAAILGELLGLAHTLSRRLAGAAGEPPARFDGPELRAALERCAAATSIPALARAWQMLLKGIDEVRQAPDAAAAGEMVLLRLACIADLPPPGELARLLLASGPGAGGAPAPRDRRVAPARPSPSTAFSTDDAEGPPAPPAERRPERPVERRGPPADLAGPAAPASFEQLLRLLSQSGERPLVAFVEQAVHLIAYEPGRILLRMAATAPADLRTRLQEAATRVTGRPWVVQLGLADGAPTIAAARDEARRRRMAELADGEALRPLLDAFPGAAIVDVRVPSARAEVPGTTLEITPPRQRSEVERR